MADKPAANRGPRGATGKTGATGRTGKQAVTPDAYLEKADKLQESLDGVRDEMKIANQRSKDAEGAAGEAKDASDRATRASRIAIVGVALALVGLFFVWQQNDELKDQNNRIEAQQAAIIAARTEARHTTCARANRTREEAGNAAARKAIDFIESQHRYLHTGPSTGELKKAEDDFIVSQKRETLVAYDKFDCTPAGIDAAYKNAPPDPYANDCVPDGKGLCL